MVHAMVKLLTHDVIFKLWLNYDVIFKLWLMLKV